MSMGSATLSTSQQATIFKSIFGSNVSIPVNFGGVTTLQAGAGAGNCNVCYAGQRTITSGVTDAMDLTDSSLSQPDGSAAVFADVVTLAIQNPATNTTNIVVGGGSGAMSSIFGASGTVTLPPGTTICIVSPVATGYSVANHKLNVVATIGSAPYNIMILGH